MKNTSKLFVLFLIALFVAFGVGTTLAASEYPNKPITLVAPVSAGGAGDIYARVLASAVQKYKLLPQPIVVENKPGGSHGVAMAYVSSKKRDPYYLINVGSTFLTTPLTGLSPVRLEDFTPIASLVSDEFALMVSPAWKLKSLKETIAYAKANPKKVTIGVAQYGGVSTMIVSTLGRETGAQFNLVSFPGNAEINAALLGGHIDLGVGIISGTMELIEAGKIGVFGVFAQERMADFRKLPTIKEAGINIVFGSHRGIAAPADIPPDARKILEETLFKVMKTEAFIKYCKDGLLNDTWMDGQTYGKFLQDSRAKYAVILEDLNLIKKK